MPADLAIERNRRFYDGLWTGAALIGPERLNTWPLVRSMLSAGAEARLEIGPGLRPRLPIGGTVFLDISQPALKRLNRAGGRGACGTPTTLPFPDDCFDLVAAFDVIEHVSDDAAAFGELARVCREGGVLLLSLPLHPQSWTAFDDLVGHCRRYEPADLLAKLAEHGFEAEQSAPFGMRPRSSRLTALGMWFLHRMPRHAMTWYNRVLFPWALRHQPTLRLGEGVSHTDAAADLFLVCRRVAGGAAARRSAQVSERISANTERAQISASRTSGSPT